ncbi:MAG: subclass B3 metallo-beta-lactamase [Bacteroidetes bacterium]|nr:subclass B3 metallo-beta-lactamase [Bacteroidota bacterium]
MYATKIKLLLVAALFTINIAAAQDIKEPKPGSAEWTQDFIPFRIAGNLYYVGTYDLACYLVVTDKGNILINTGLASSAEQIKKNITTLGFKYTDIKILLTTQAHYDHVGAMAAIKKETGATFMADAADIETLQNGSETDYAMGGKGKLFVPITVDRSLKNKSVIKLGDTRLTLLHHPGHTKGSCSYLFTTKDSSKSYRVLIANMPSIIIDTPFAAVNNYPAIAKDYAYTLKSLKALHFDIWVASHASQFDLHSKYHPGDVYNPMAFADQKGYDEELESLQKAYDEKMKKEPTVPSGSGLKH